MAMNMMDKETRRKVVYAAIPLTMFVISRYIYSALFLFLLSPFVIVILIERRGISTLGVRFEREKIRNYLFYTFAGFLALMLVLIVDIFLWRRVSGEVVDLSGPTSYSREFVDQIFFVAGPEEVFYRGYMMTRMGDWLGSVWGLFSSSFLFGLEHFLTRFFMYGLTFPASLWVGISSMIGGLIFGWQFQRTKSIFPSLIAHIAQNLFGYVITAFILGT
jgi:membrane protease YdiL (CAAX protease family)